MPEWKPDAAWSPPTDQWGTDSSEVLDQIHREHGAWAGDAQQKAPEVRFETPEPDNAGPRALIYTLLVFNGLALGYLFFLMIRLLVQHVL